MKLINSGDLFMNLDDVGLLAYKHDDTDRSEFRMKAGYVFTILDLDQEHFIKVLMSNTGKIQYVNRREFDAFLHGGYIKKLV